MAECEKCAWRKEAGGEGERGGGEARTVEGSWGGVEAWSVQAGLGHGDGGFVLSE